LIQAGGPGKSGDRGRLPLSDNYFWRVSMTGRYSPECCPEYLKPDNFQMLKDGLAERLSVHTDSVLGFLEKHDGPISRFALSDHMDWLSGRYFPLLEAEWQAIVDRAAAGARLIWRSAGSQTEYVNRAGVWVDMGGGTGANLEYSDPRIGHLAKLYVVDLSPSMLAVARNRIRRRGWQNVEIVQADATSFRPAEDAADVVTFSYSLTMIPDWVAAVENALAILKPAAQIGIVDFYVARESPADGWARHSWFTRSFWPFWFAAYSVFPSPDHVSLLHRHFAPAHFVEGWAKVPYVPLIRVPYYTFVGRKRGEA